MGKRPLLTAEDVPELSFALFTKRFFYVFLR